jgi:hypothetical protein
MSAVRYPIAANAEAALSAPIGRAARLSEAILTAGGEANFVTEAVGPAFPTRQAALDAYAGRVDDDTAGRNVSIAPEDRFCDLRELSAARLPRPGGVKAMKPVYRGGRRWPAPQPAQETIWRLSISYWRTGLPVPAAEAEPAAAAPERPAVDAQALRARLAQPLRPVKAQQPLDIGLFEVRPPEAPHILMPDE